jgi:ATP-dependent DNA ligase
MSGFSLAVDTPPMEARTEAEIPTAGGPWQYEPKWDGFRCLAFRNGDAVDLRGKSGKPLGRYFPEIVEALRLVRCESFVVDGELVIERNGRLSFDDLQLRLHPAASRIRRLSAEMPGKLILFDILAREDAAILGSPLLERRAALEAFAQNVVGESIVLSPHSRRVAQARRWLERAGPGSIDGVVAKHLNEPYRPGERDMVKVKKIRTADCVVGGYRYLRGKRQIGSLLLGLYNRDGALDHVGHTSTIAAGERPALTKRLESLRAPPGFTGKAPGGPSRWSTERSGEWEPVRPVLVVEVRFDHASGHRFRHGTKLLRWRTDKVPRQCTLDQLGPIHKSRIAGRLRAGHRQV